jgi:hypothetical protein
MVNCRFYDPMIGKPKDDNPPQYPDDLLEK